MYKQPSSLSFFSYIYIYSSYPGFPPSIKHPVLQNKKMELNGDGFLEELLSLGRETWEANPLFSANWGFNTFDANPIPPPTLPILPNTYDCFSTFIKPDLEASFNEFYSPDLIDDGSYQNYKNQMETTSFPAQEDFSMSVIEDDNINSQYSVDLQTACKLENTRQTAEIPAFNMGMCVEKKSKVKRVEGQPSKNLMAERRRRKRLNDRLSMLRSVVPKISKMDRTSILGDTIDYMKELLERINSLQEEMDGSSSEVNEMSIFRDLRQNDTLMRNSPKFDVERRNSHTRVEISCSGKQGLLLSTVTTLEALGLEIQQCVISCFNDFSLHAACSEDLEQRTAVSSEDIKQALFRNAGYGGRCL